MIIIILLSNKYYCEEIFVVKCLIRFKYITVWICFNSLLFFVKINIRCGNMVKHDKKCQTVE